MPRLVADRLGKRFGRRVLFRNLSFELAGGASLAVTGANGSGKSTLVRILAGVLRPTRGTVSLVGSDGPVPDDERPLRTGLVAPYLNVYDGFTARENLRFLARARRLPEADGRIREVLDAVELGDRGDDLVGTYSSGMKQRARFAAALLADPVVLILDEPTSNLDDAGRAMVDRVMAAHLARGGLLVVATNVAEEAARCDARLRIEAHR